MRFFLARSGISGFTRPDEFDLCGCCCCEAPRIYQWLCEADGVIRWLIYAPKGGETQYPGFKFNPHRWTGPEDPRAHLCLGPEAWARQSRIGRGLSFASVHRWKSNFQYVTFAVLIVEPSMATWYMVPMPSMIDTYDLKLFYTLCTYNSIKWFVLNVLSMFGYYKGKPYPRLRCIVWWDLGLIIASFLEKHCVVYLYALVFLGENPFRVIRRGPLNYSLLKIKFLNNCFSSHTSPMTDLEFIVLT